MRVLMINSVCGIRSTGRICTDIADVLSDAGHEVKIAYGRGVVPKDYLKYAIKIGNGLDEKIHWLLTRLFDRHGFGSKRATVHLIKYIKEYQPDVIHLHNIHGYYINIKVLFDFLKEYDRPVIWTLHDCWSFTGHCSHFDFIGCERWVNGCFNCPLKKDYPSSYLIDRSKRNYSDKKKLFSGLNDLTIVTPSKWLADLVRKSYMKEYEVCVIPNGISTEAFKYRKSDFKEKHGIENKRLILGVAGIWNKTKGLEDFVKLSEIADEKYAFVIVGRIQEKAKVDLGKSIYIEHTDNVSELAEIYSSADYFFNPTKEDNYPTVNLEACACGTPVISYKTGGSPEGVFKGTVVEKGDYRAAYEWIRQHENEDRNTSDYLSEIDRKTMVERYCSLILKTVKGTNQHDGYFE